MVRTPNLRDVGTRVEEILAELRGGLDPAGVVERAEELVRLLMELYGAGLERMVSVAGAVPDGDAVVRRLADDPLIKSLLVLHDLHPVPLEERVRGALDKVRPFLGVNAGGVTFGGVDDEGVVHLQMEGSCQGCPSSAVTAKLAIERAIVEAAPEVTGVAVEEVSAGPQNGPVRVEIGRRPSDRNEVPIAAPARGRS
jgi:Fe-S cluster biogenesis protein NfuA